MKMKTKRCKECGIIYKRLVCPNCNHQWDTKSKLSKVTCPSCNLKIPNPNYMKEDNKQNAKKNSK